MSLRNPTYNQLAQAAHAGVAAALVFTASILAGSKGQLVCTASFIVYGLLKEFIFDLIWERPEVSGGVEGGVIDFIFYMVGLVFANAVIFIKGGL